MIFLVAFAGFTLLGFLIARGLFLIFTQMSNPTPTLPVVPKPGKTALLLIRMNDLEIQDPVVLSIWRTSISPGNPPQATFEALYPGSGYETGPVLSFSMDENGLPTPWSLYNLNLFNVPWDGYVMFDQAGYQWIVNTLSAYSSQSQGDTMGNTQTAYDSIQNEHDWYQHLCRLLPLDPGIPDWSEVTPFHLRTDLNSETGNGFWRMLQLTNLECQMVILQ